MLVTNARIDRIKLLKLKRDDAQLALDTERSLFISDRLRSAIARSGLTIEDNLEELRSYLCDNYGPEGPMRLITQDEFSDLFHDGLHVSEAISLLQRQDEFRPLFMGYEGIFLLRSASSYPPRHVFFTR